MLLTAREQAAEPVMNEIAALLKHRRTCAPLVGRGIARRWQRGTVVAPEYSGGQLPAVRVPTLRVTPAESWRVA